MQESLENTLDRDNDGEKLNDYLISGKPVIFACNYNNAVKDAGQFGIPSDNVDIFAQTILEVKSLDSFHRDELALKSKRLIREVYDYKMVSQKYIDLLEEL